MELYQYIVTTLVGPISALSATALSYQFQRKTQRTRTIESKTEEAFKYLIMIETYFNQERIRLTNKIIDIEIEKQKPMENPPFDDLEVVINIYHKDAKIIFQGLKKLKKENINTLIARIYHPHKTENQKKELLQEIEDLATHTKDHFEKLREYLVAQVA